MSSLLSSMGCSWNTNEATSPHEKSMPSSISIERIPAHKVSHPSFSLTDNTQVEQEDEEEKDDDSNSSSHRRKAVQSKASKLMSRKCVYSQDNKDVDNGQQRSQAPQRIMLENILDSFDQLVDARIRAYAQILSNHVRVLSESNNTRGARIAEYKLQTLLEFATNNLLFDSISTEFKTSSATEDGVCGGGDIVVSTTSTSTSATEEKNLSLPIELTVEIRSPRFFHEGLDAVNRGDATGSSNPRHQQGKLTFQAKGKVRVDRLFIGQNKSNDTGRCLMPGAECRNSKNLSHVPRDSSLENIEIEIDCNALLSQMMEEASKVVTMAVELTNLTWTNNTQKQEEINQMNMNDMMAERTQNTANIIVDDDDCSTAGERLPQTMTGKRSRCEDHPDTHTHAGTTMSKQVSEASFCPHVQVVCDEEHIEEPHVSNDDASSAAATITNIHLLDQDACEPKTRYFVSDPSYEASESGSDHEHHTEGHHQDEKCPPHNHDNGDECFSKISAERACHIVDFVLAGDMIPCAFSSNKKLRTK